MRRSLAWNVMIFLVLLPGSVKSEEPVYGENSPERAHWAFKTATKAALTDIEKTDWPQQEFDILVLRHLESQGIEPSPPADRQTIIRRLYYDLLGLPPTFDQVQQFLNDTSPTAYQGLVDRLLESEHFGERWARHWLDIARFSDTKGYVFTESRDYPHAYKYRDWVINAFNNDMPIDRFMKYQLAADQMVEGDDTTDLAAMGYLTLGRRFINNKHDIIDDRIDVVFRGLMGLTVACARCHDHMYDPVATKDYYALYGVFASSDEQQDEGLPLRLKDADKPHDARIFERGNPSSKADVAPRRFLPFFDPAGELFQSGSGRRELAEAIANADNPLTSRVFVNRVWAHLMGTPIVSTPSDLGMRTDSPPLADVLDHLAETFVADDAWSFKQLVRRIVTSSVYQQSSSHNAVAWTLDPANQYYWRSNRKRLDFEAMRDSLLAVSGHLDPSVGGPSVRIETDPSTNRRTLYAFIDRQNLPAIFRTFDFASPDTHSPKRPSTVVPQQALFLLNSPFSHAMAVRLAERASSQTDIDARIRELYKLAFAREPSDEELAFGKEFASQSLADNEVVQPSDPWQFGYGYLGEKNTVVFHPLPHFTGKAWQGGPERPDPEIGWVIVEPESGHPGNDQQHAAIRRWVVPADGTLKIEGKLNHPADKGDGVRARVVSSRSGLAGEWTAQHAEVTTKTEALEVRAGDTIDLIVDCRTNEGHDSFIWPAKFHYQRADRNSEEIFMVAEGFHGPLPKPLDLWQRYTHTLLLTNEFHFLD